MRGVVTLAVLAATLVIGATAGAARTAQATVVAYPSGTTFSATGSAPAHGSSSVTLAMPIGAIDDAVLLVHGAQTVSAVPAIDPALKIQLLFAHYVSVDRKLVPDALLPWNGGQRATEHTNQPVWVRITVPQGTAPGTYLGQVSVATDGGAPRVIPITVDVPNVTIPAQNAVAGNLLTGFNVSAQSYGNEVHKLYGVTPDQSLPGFFRFLASYRISPNSWGYGNPSSKRGYTSSGAWYKDRGARMAEAVGDPRQFAAMWIPVSNQRSTRSEWVAGLSPYTPKKWCPYLKAVRDFWQKHNWLPGYPYLYGMDEPGAKLYRVLRLQAEVVHRCWPGSHLAVTTRPQPSDRFLWNGGNDDIDTFVILTSRFYGEYTNPTQYRDGRRRATMYYRYIEAAHKRGKDIWTYTYNSPAHRTPGLAAVEHASAPRMLTAWAALEGVTGILRGQAMTAYSPGSNPLDVNNKDAGDYVLIYPGKNAPVPSARLEELREGIEDWDILDIVRQKHGSKAVVKLLSHLFSTTATGAKLACDMGCPIKNKLPYSWPLFSNDASTATKLAQMRSQALAAASS